MLFAIVFWLFFVACAIMGLLTWFSLENRSKDTFHKYAFWSSIIGGGMFAILAIVSTCMCSLLNTNCQSENDADFGIEIEVRA